MFKYHLWRKGLPKHARNKLAETYNRALDSQLKTAQNVSNQSRSKVAEGS